MLGASISVKTRPLFSKSSVNKAGDAIRRNEHFIGISGKRTLVHQVIENHRAAHAYVLNTFQANLRNRSRAKNITFAQRLKRRPTIYNKLRREHKMQLARMHDIAGCRLIFSNIDELNHFQKEFRNARFNHIRRHRDDSFDPYDYIAHPKHSGYRGRHDVFEYRAYAPSGRPWNGLYVEIQYRTQTQHAWATAVEIAGSITENKPKFDQGDPRYLNFFRLSSEILARTAEGMTSCCAELTDKELVDKFMTIEDDIHLLRHLENINLVNHEFSFRRNVILIFNEHTGELETESYRDAPDALERYFELENSQNADVDVVLVRADSSESIRYAFRNYFSDSQEFVRLMHEALFTLGL